MAKKTASKYADYPDAIIGQAMTFKGKAWIGGSGSFPSDYMFVGEKPGQGEARTKAVFTGPGGQRLLHRLEKFGFDMRSVYYTNAVKYALPPGKSAKISDITACSKVLAHEIEECKPKVIICLGAQALKAVSGAKVGISVCRGEFRDHPDYDAKIFAMHSPAYTLRSEEVLPAFEKDIKTLVAYQNGTYSHKYVPQFALVKRADNLRKFADMIEDKIEKTIIVVDCEWHGKNWMDPDRYFRSVQLGYDHGKVVIAHFTHPGGVQAMDDPIMAWQQIKRILESPKVGVVGHNVIADGEWLRTQNIDIRKNVVWDTMLGEYILNESGPWNLNEVTIKYTDYGRYAMELDIWVKANKELTEDGYGFVPDEMLMPYAAIDVDGPRQIMEKQYALVKEEGFLEKRGDFCSLWKTTLRTQELMYELQSTGMLVDMERLSELIDAYQGVRTTLHGLITSMAANYGVPNFNPASVQQVAKMLFTTLKLSPVKSTDGKAWGEQVGNTGLDSDVEINPSTDKTTLEILEDDHAFVKYMLQFRRIDQACKTWLRWPDEHSKSGGIPGLLWTDGRLHSRFSPLTETSRFRTSKPNSQNWPKKAEGYMINIFGGKDKVPPGIRTIIIPRKGWGLMEADFTQAELFVLAALSGDDNMWTALRTPGRDLHDLTAITAFDLKVLNPAQEIVPEQFLIDMAARLKDVGGDDSEEYKKYIKSLVYLDTKGKTMTRDEFKSTIRVSAKNLNFGCNTDEVMLLCGSEEVTVAA